MKVALVHDYLREYGGAERVVETLHEMWPDAPLYTSFVDWSALGRHADRFRGWDIRTSWVQRNPIVKKFHSPLRFLAPKIWGSFDLSGYDLVISSSGWFMSRGVHTRAEGSVPWPRDGQGPDLFGIHDRSGAKAVTVATNGTLPRAQVSYQSSLSPRRANSDRPTKINQQSTINPSTGSGLTLSNVERVINHQSKPLHICYIHHPPRNLYGYPTGSLLQRYWPVRVYAAIINFFLRHYDFETAQRVDYFIANSKETARRVWKFYRREATVIYPPVENSKLKTQNSKRQRKSKNYYLSVGRLTYSKRVDLAIAAANDLKLPLKIVGSGPEEQRLRAIASPTVEFLGSVSDEELHALYSQAKALLFCALDEDFGMVPVEAMAHGTPVVALAQGGVVESVVDGETGMLFRKPVVEDLVQTLKTFEKTKRAWDRACREHAARFGKERFIKELTQFVQEKTRAASSK